MSHPFGRVSGIALATLAILAAGDARALVTFDAPHAGTSEYTGTFPAAINARGAIAGWYRDAGTLVHPFVRDAAGVLTEFEVPGLRESYVTGMNGPGKIVGYGLDARSKQRGWVRDARGRFTILTAPGAATVTQPYAINDDGVIAGIYLDGRNAAHGFLRDGAGQYVTVDAPGAGQGEGQGTNVLAIDASGAVTGNFVDRSWQVHGFVRDASGAFTVFDPAGAGVTFATAISPEGLVGGSYYPSGSNSVAHAYVRDSLGSIDEFDVPGFTIADTSGINDTGTVVGSCFAPGLSWNAFRRSPSGRVQLLPMPAGTTQSAATGVNAGGVITGYQTDANGVSHGFVD